jgi:hypothetical protein
MKWILLPLLAATALGWSGFLDRLDATTIESARLARASEEAPESTAQAAEETAALPSIARLTGRQADAFRALADALGISAGRVFRLNDSLGTQAERIGGIAGGIGKIRRTLGCVSGRLRALLATSQRVPGAVTSIRTILADVERTQVRSIRHLRSINRKLTALGAVARATDVKAPPPPRIGPVGLSAGGSRPVPC